MKVTSKIVSLILLIVFFVGLCVLLYPAFSQYWNSKVQSRAVADYEKMLREMSKEDYTAVFESAYAYNDSLRELEFPMTEYNTISGYNDALNLNGQGMMGYITIQKLSVELPIYHSVTAEVLNIAAGHLPGTTLPVGGESTHAVLSAHRGLPNAKLFTDLDKLQIGDTFTITILDRVLTYQVDQVKIVEPSQADDLQIEYGRDYVTLLTCTPYGINSHRLLVRGHRIETVEQHTYYITAEAYLIDRLIVTPLVALPILFLLIVYVLFKPVKKKPDLSEDDPYEVL